MDIKGMHAFVTGGGTGIGLAIARDLADRGAQVTITGRRLDVLQSVATKGLHPAALDVQNETAIRDTVAASISARGPIQICVANAGLAEGRTFPKTSSTFWRNIMATNLDGAFLTIRECLPSMRETDWGRVIAVSSIAGLRGLPGAAAYSASKHGLIGLVRSLSEEFMGGTITFNSICPGYTDTPIVDRNEQAIAEKTGISVADARKSMTKANRHNRLVDVAEIAAVTRWLTGPASGSINGQNIEIAGGQT
ncbi:MAG: SDR family NAD(P)-dependent oxidoreductase [Paracoccaceae bacterium]